VGNEHVGKLWITAKCNKYDELTELLVIVSGIDFINRTGLYVRQDV